MGAERTRLLLYSSLYPNSIQRRHGIFVETRLRHLIESGDVEAKVVAPVPWFPFTGKNFGQYAEYAKVPKQESRHNINIFHPKYPVLPKIGMNLSPISMAAASMPIISQLIRQGRDFDIIDAHYFYPDGVAAAFIAMKLGKPFVITARGTDINLISRYRIPGKMILRAAENAQKIIAVSSALKDRLSEIGVNPEKVVVLRNGVDPNLFMPSDREEERRNLGVSGPLLVSVGNLVESKGHDLVIEALANLEGMTLIVIGEGPERKALEDLATRLGVSDRVRFMGNLPQGELCNYYTAADALILASSREGWPNVLLEAMACGTPVVATDVGGTKEAVCSPEAGLLVRERTPESIADAVLELVSNPPSREETRKHACKFGWDEVSRGQKEIFREILSSRGAP